MIRTYFPGSLRFGSQSLFLAILTSSALIWLASVSSTRIETLDLGIFPQVTMFPLPYWFGLALLSAATLAWGAAQRTEKVHSLLAVFWALYLYVGPVLMESNVRINDTYDFLFMINYVEQARFPGGPVPAYPEYGYSVFPGYFYLASTLHLVTGVGYYALAKLLLIALLLIALAAILLFAHSIFKEGRAFVFASLVLIALMWPSVTHPSPFTMGSVLFVFLVGVLFNRKVTASRMRLAPVAVMFVSLVISHGPAPYVLLILISVIAFASWFKKSIPLMGKLSANSLMFMAIAFAAWIANSSDWVVRSTIQGFQNYILAEHFGLAFEEVSTNLTPYRISTIIFSYSFATIVGVWFVVLIARRDFWRKPTTDRILPILCVLASSLATITIPAYLLNASERIFIFTFPFIAWFVVAETLKGRRRRRRHLATCLVLILLILAFFARYSREPVLIFPASEIQGNNFLLTRSPLSATVYYDTLAPWPSAITDHLLQPKIMGRTNYMYEVKNDLLNHTNELVISSTTQKKLLYYYGQNGLDTFNRMIESQTLNTVYSSGYFLILAEPY